MSPAEPTTHSQTYCRICVALCGLVVETRGERVVRVREDPKHPVSRGYSCPKGRAIDAQHHDPLRLDVPEIRRGDHLAPASWEESLADVEAIVRKNADAHGPDSIGFYLGTISHLDTSGRVISDALIRALGTRSRYTTLTTDCPAKPLVSELITNHFRLFPLIHEDARFVLFIGINPVVSHGHTSGFPDPVSRIRRFASQGEVWVLDPLKTKTAKLATHHLALRPGTDYAVLAFLIRELLVDGADREYLARYTSGLETLERVVQPFDVDRAAGLSGLEARDLEALLGAVRRAGRVAALTGTGASMSAAANATEWLTWALGAVTGSLDRAGGMWFSPGFLSSLDSTLGPGGKLAAEPGPASRPELPRRYDQYPCAALSDEIEAGNIRVLFSLAGNPAAAVAEPARFAAATRKLDAFVVSDILRNETVDLASHVWPTLGQLERPDVPLYCDVFGPAVSSQYTPAIVKPVAERRAFWWPLSALADRLGHSILPGGLSTETATDDALLDTLVGAERMAALRAEKSAVVRDTDGVGWLLDGKALPDGRFRLAPPELVEQLGQLPEPPALSLIPRRQLRQMNTLHARVARPDRLEVTVHPADADAAGVRNGDRVRVSSRVGSIVAPARVSDDVRRGTVSIPHGFSGDGNVNALLSCHEYVDPLTGMILQSGVEIELART